ncbi:MAG TPA: hypothetical protein VLZ10_08790 [Thermodesulfobacteriota bacterium]|nr:hypothetical protein [Thermodesulfobacteriota bacterium]
MNTRKLFQPILIFFLIVQTTACAPKKDLEVDGKKLVSRKPPFTLALPSDIDLIHSFSDEHPGQNSLTRVYFFVKAKERRVEEMLIVQIADRTNPQAGPMGAPPLKPYTEKRSYLKGKLKKGELELEYLIQSMAWNPDAPSLQPIIKKGFLIPPHWALQGQFLFLYQGEHVIFLRYSKDITSFGIKISENRDDWEKGVISGNEKRVYQDFEKSFMQVMDSIQVKID